MKKSILLLLFTTIGAAQNINTIITVNDEVIVGNIGGLRLEFVNDNELISIPVNYYPGDLVLDETSKTLIMEGKYNSCKLKFDYYTYQNEEQEIANYFIELKDIHFKQPYLLIKIYDFRNKKYKRWYQYLTKEKYLIELNFPNSGIYVRQK